MQRKAIVTAELEPGRRLSENQLAELIGAAAARRCATVGAPARRALVAIVRRSARSTYINEQAIADAHFVREALEGGESDRGARRPA